MAFNKYDETGNVVKAHKVMLDCQKAIVDGEIIRVEQAHKDEVDINVIVQRHGHDMELIAKTAALTQFVYDDVSDNDFEETMNLMIRAKDTFSNVPSKIRAQFDNNPAKFMDFVHNPENSDKLVEMGLANPPEPAPEPVQVAVVSQPPETTETPPA